MSTVVTVPEIGLHTDIPMRDYLALSAMSASRLEALRRSPLQYQHSLTVEPETSEALERGEALHCALLEPDRFAARYLIAGACVQLLKSGARKGEPCGNPGIALHDELGWLCGMHMKGFGSGIRTDVEVLSQANHEAATGMRDAILGHPRARTLVEGRGGSEITGIFADPETGVLCKIRPDRLVERSGVLVEIKTTRDAAPWAFPGDAERRGYFRKLALYRRGLRALGWDYQATAIIAVESERPHDLICYLLDEEDLDAADREVSRLLRQYRTCEEVGVWPGYQSGEDGFVILRRPDWAKDFTETEVCDV